MFDIGDLVIYSAHGLCKVIDIREKTVLGTTKMYYELQPMDNYQHLTFSVPVSNEKNMMLELMETEEANEILHSFTLPALEWIDKANLRYKQFSDLASSGDRKKVAQVINTLMRRSLEVNEQEKKLGEQDRKLLDRSQTLLFKELAVSLKLPLDEVHVEVSNLIRH